MQDIFQNINQRSVIHIPQHIIKFIAPRVQNVEIERHSQSGFQKHKEMIFCKDTFYKLEGQFNTKNPVTDFTLTSQELVEASEYLFKNPKELIEKIINYSNSIEDIMRQYSRSARIITDTPLTVEEAESAKIKTPSGPYSEPKRAMQKKINTEWDKNYSEKYNQIVAESIIDIDISKFELRINENSEFTSETIEINPPIEEVNEGFDGNLDRKLEGANSKELTTRLAAFKKESIKENTKTVSEPTEIKKSMRWGQRFTR